MYSALEQVRRLGLSEGEIDLNLNIGLYQEPRLGLGKAAEPLGMDRVEFMGLLPVHSTRLDYSWEDYRQDPQTLATLDFK